MRYRLSRVSHIWETRGHWNERGRPGRLDFRIRGKGERANRATLSTSASKFFLPPLFTYQS